MYPCPWISATNSQLLDILLSESKRWETVVISHMYDRSLHFNTPQLRTLECHMQSLGDFYAPNLSRLRINGYRNWPSTIKLPTPICKDLRHLHLQIVFAYDICSIIASFPHLETIVVGHITSHHSVPGTRSNSATLELMTLPLPSALSDHFRQEFIDIFALLHLPTPKKRQVDCLLSMLAVASFQVPVVDFQMDTPLRKVHMTSIEPLLSVVGEVTFCGKLLQINEYRRMGKLKLRFSR
ncbi:hypothetical protein EDB19DRAFT_1742468 [Suillus lakei]|nr:hypothetical protein EDB19DRAFT_1742468 [Suillus lakei]